MSNLSNARNVDLRTHGALAYKQEAVTDTPSVGQANGLAVMQLHPKPKLRRLLRAIVTLMFAVALIVCAGATWFYWVARQALPQVNGKIAVNGLSAPVRVIRDARGVPHILADNAEDLFLAQGYVTAQDRLWQLDLSRRLADGTASEVMGPAFLDHDKEQRILGLRAVAHRSWQALSTRDRSNFAAYARGVNAYIESHRKNLPIEFRVLRYTPKPWTGEDSLLCGILMSEGLNHGLFETKLVREKIIAKLGSELAAYLYPNSSWRDHPPGVDEKTSAPRLTPAAHSDLQSPSNPSVHLQLPRTPLRADDALVPGSNNWVISGMHTVTGKPLLSNDMHLGLRIPNTWYEAQLEIQAHSDMPRFDVVGFTLPGLPYVLVGHNQHIAWGFTNLVPDVEDVFVENVRAGNEYETPDGWKPVEKRHEVIRVKGKPDVAMDVMLTRHGPVVTNLLPGEKRTLALDWDIYDEPVTVPFAALDAAQNWQEFRSALAQFYGPAQNVVYADVDGNIGYQAAGHIPIRKSGDGSLPVSGSDDTHEWTGYIPFDRLPSIYDPPSGIIATANGRVTPDSYPYSISTQWGSPYRTERIYQVLDPKKQFSAADLLALQMDTYSAFDRFCAQHFVSAVNHSPKSSPRVRQAAELMQNWSGWVSTDTPAPTLIAEARNELLRLMLKDRLKTAGGQSQDGWDIDWTDYHWFMSSVALENILTQQPLRWLPKSFANYDDLLTAAVENAVNEKDAPSDLAAWKWGSQLPLVLQHPIFGKIPILNHWSGTGTMAVSGDAYTVKAAGGKFGPSERMTVNLANLDASNFNLLSGESAQLFSPHYMDQWSAWYEGFSFPMPFSDDEVDKSKKNDLTLIPR